MKLRLAIVVVLMLATRTVDASELPRFQLEATCRAAPRLLAQDPDPFARCMKDERAARSELEQSWASFDVTHRQLCVRETTLDDTPSYVEVLTCLQMYATNSSPSRRRP